MAKFPADCMLQASFCLGLPRNLDKHQKAGLFLYLEILAMDTQMIFSQPLKDTTRAKAPGP
jgi:hypothetical protein